MYSLSLFRYLVISRASVVGTCFALEISKKRNKLDRQTDRYRIVLYSSPKENFSVVAAIHV